MLHHTGDAAHWDGSTHSSHVEQQQETGTLRNRRFFISCRIQWQPCSQQEQCIPSVEQVLWTPRLFREEGRGDPPEVIQRTCQRLNLSFDATMVSFVPANWRDLRTFRLHLCITLHSMSDNCLKKCKLSICPKLPFHITSQQPFLFSLCSCHSWKAHWIIFHMQTHSMLWAVVPILPLSGILDSVFNLYKILALLSGLTSLDAFWSFFFFPKEMASPDALVIP